LCTFTNVVSDLLVISSHCFFFSFTVAADMAKEVVYITSRISQFHQKNRHNLLHTVDNKFNNALESEQNQ